MMDNADPPVSFPYTIWPSVNREYSTSKQTRLRGSSKFLNYLLACWTPSSIFSEIALAKGIGIRI